MTRHSVFLLASAPLLQAAKALRALVAARLHLTGVGRGGVAARDVAGVDAEDEREDEHDDAADPAADHHPARSPAAATGAHL